MVHEGDKRSQKTERPGGPTTVIPMFSFPLFFGAFFSENNPLWWGVVKNEMTFQAYADLATWILLFIIFLFGGIIVLHHIRNNAKSETDQDSDETILDQIETLYERKLITYDEFQMIRKNLRDQLVVNAIESEKRAEKRAEEKKQRKEAPKRKRKMGKLSDQEKEDLLNSLLKGQKE